MRFNLFFAMMGLGLIAFMGSSFAASEKEAMHFEKAKQVQPADDEPESESTVVIIQYA